MTSAPSIAQADSPEAKPALAGTSGAGSAPLRRRGVAAWQIAGGLVILFAGSFLHFLFELAGFNQLAAPFGSVNESTWEHLKLFYWPLVAVAVVEHAYLRHRVANFWLAKGVSAALIPVGVVVSFYAYLGVVLPIAGKGTFLGTMVTAIIGIVLGQYTSYRLLTGSTRASWTRLLGIGILLMLGALFVLFTFAPPHIFLFENFFNYTYDGQFGILRDYTNYRVFK